MLLTKSFPPEAYRRGLESWGWIGLDGKMPVLASLFGDLFLLDQGGGYWFLDTIVGSLERQWTDRTSLEAALADADGQDQFLRGGLAMAAERRGLSLGPDQVYAYAPPPIVGGSFDVANIMVLDLVVALHIAGQVHDQVRGMPPGSTVSGLRLADDGPPAAAGGAGPGRADDGEPPVHPQQP